MGKLASRCLAGTLDVEKLPKGMHFKNGGFYLVKRNNWTFLGRLYSAALRSYSLLISEVPESRYLRILDRCIRNAKMRELEFHLTKDEFWEIVARANGRCELTKIPFSTTNDTSSRRAPFAPSIDRIDCSKPYTKENCRLVCVCVNAALSDWGDAIFFTMVKAAKVI